VEPVDQGRYWRRALIEDALHGSDPGSLQKLLLLGMLDAFRDGMHAELSAEVGDRCDDAAVHRTLVLRPRTVDRWQSAQALSRTKAPIPTIAPVRSAISMNEPGWSSPATDAAIADLTAYLNRRVPFGLDLLDVVVEA
jgi:hypothetical protein